MTWNPAVPISQVASENGVQLVSGPGTSAADPMFNANPLVLASGTITANGDEVVFATMPLEGVETFAAQITGTFVGTLTFQFSINGTDWNSLNVRYVDGVNPAVNVASATLPGHARGSIAGYGWVRVKATAWTSGTATVSLAAGGGTATTSLHGQGTVSSAPLYVQGVDSTASGSVAANGQAFVVGPKDGMSTWQAQIVLSAAGSLTFLFEASEDGTTWTPVFGQQDIQNAQPESGITVSGTGAYVYTGNCAGYKRVRVRTTAYTAGGTNSVTLKTTPAFGPTFLSKSLPVGSNVIGGVTQSGTWTVALAPGSSTDNGTDITAASMEPGGVGLQGWVSQLAHDSWHYRQEVLSQHGEVKVAPKTVQLHLSGVYPVSVLRDRTTLVSGGTVTKSGGEYLVTTAAGANSAAKIDSVHRGSYVCGLGAIAETSIRVPTAPTGQQVGEWYYADASNGYGFGVDTTGVYVWYMKAAAKTKVYQANWNADKLNGTGHSGKTLSLSNGAVFFIDFTWFGYGIVEWGILAKSEDGRQHKIICHSHQTAAFQSTDDVNLPLGVSVANGTATSSFTVAVGGRVFSIMGSYTVPHRSAGANLLYSFTNSQFTDQYVLAVRKKSGAGFISVKTLLNALNISGATRELLVKIVANPTIASPTWNAPTGVAASETACEVATNGTYTANSGVQVYSTYTSGTGRIVVQGDEIDHIELTDVFAYAIVIQNQTTSNGTAKVSLNWQEGW